MVIAVARPSVRSLVLATVPAVLAITGVVVRCAGLSSTVLWDLSWSLAATSAIGGAFLAWRAGSGDARARWALWTLASVLWLTGQLIWDFFDIVGHPSSPNPADFCWWGFAVVVMVSTVTKPARRRSLRLFVTLESLPLIGAAVALTVAMLWDEVAHSRLPESATISALTYPVLYVAMAVLILQALIGGQVRAVRSPGALLAVGGILAQAAAFTVWTDPLLQQQGLLGADMLDTTWVIGLCAIGLGGVLAARRPEPDEQIDEEPGPRNGLLPAGVFLMLLAASVTARLNHAAPGAITALEAGLLFAGGTLILRSALLARRLRTMLENERGVREDLVVRESELTQLNEQLVEDSRRDALTGLRNRRALAEDLAILDDVHDHSREAIAFALLDIDHFKAYNDRHGHLAGDQALRGLASIVLGALRETDTAYRFGGEELLILLHTGTASEALRAAERVRSAVQTAAYPHPKGIGGILTVSIGVAVGQGSTGDLIGRADAALYEAKHTGRNRVMLAGHDLATASPVRNRGPQGEEPVPRHLRSLMRITRAGAAGQGSIPVLEALADTIRTDFGFGVVAVNKLDADREMLSVVTVSGDSEAREALQGTSSPLSEWESILTPERERCGAYWLPAGSYEWNGPGFWTPLAVPTPLADAWHPDDMLLLPLRGADGATLGFISVDQPRLGRRPDDAELMLLMAVVDHAALAVERAQRGDETAGEQPGELRMAAVMLLAETLDLRDAGTARHSRNVGEFAREAAEALGLPPERVERIRAAGVLHDLGKLGIADKILLKPGSLDEAEWREMERHSEVGARILEHAGMHDIAAWVRSHHERLDGGGYPRALGAEEISVEARILAVADAYEAMIADRPYRAAMAAGQARAELRRCAGTQFDGKIVEAFLGRRDAEEASTRVEHRELSAPAGAGAH